MRFNVLTPLTTSRTLARVGLWALAVGAYSLLPVWKEDTRYDTVADLTPEIHAALTIVLGWLLVFRTNTAYARWWEARTMWGALVNSSRNLAAKLGRLADLPPEARERTRQIIIAYPIVLRDHLRGEQSLEQVRHLIGDHAEGVHVPSALVGRMYAELARCRTDGSIDDVELRIIDTELRTLLEICGGCERIRNTRIVRSYRVFAQQCIFLYLATLPWGIVDSFHWWTVPLTVISSYFMLGMETVAEHIEEPFGLDEDDLNLDVLCETIERTVEQIFGDKPAVTGVVSDFGP
jgi:ion channel-forming bestrophin family protein